MKYFVYSFLWRNRADDSFKNCSTFLFEGKSVIDLYEHAVKQPEYWCITSVTEITKEEYESAISNGKIG